MATYEQVTLRYTDKTFYPVNRYAAERQARAWLKTHRTDTAIRKTMAPGKITLRHRETGATAVILLQEIELLD